MFTPVITINRVPCSVPTVYQLEHVVPTRELAALAAEISERLDEMEELKNLGGVNFVLRLSGLAVESPRGFKILIQLLHGNTNALRSFADQAHLRGKTKQAVHCEFRTVCEKIQRFFPQVAAQFAEMREHALAHEDPMSREEALRLANGDPRAD